MSCLFTQWIVCE